MENPEPGPAVPGAVIATPQRGLPGQVQGPVTHPHRESDLLGGLAWCGLHRLDPLVATRPDIELYPRWLQEVHRFKPSTVSRRMSVVASFYRTFVIDGALEHSPTEYVRRPMCQPSPRRSGSPICSSRRSSPQPGRGPAKASSRS
jgi:integrase/recombinase XerD